MKTILILFIVVQYALSDWVTEINFQTIEGNGRKEYYFNKLSIEVKFKIGSNLPVDVYIITSKEYFSNYSLGKPFISIWQQLNTTQYDMLTPFSASKYYLSNPLLLSTFFLI